MASTGIAISTEGSAGADSTDRTGARAVTTRCTRLSKNRGADSAPLDRPYQEWAVEYDVFRQQLAHLGGSRLAGLP